MAGVVFWTLVALATLTSLATAWALGANSNSPPFAPAIGANAISTMRAAFLIGILAALGALTQGGAISETVGVGLIDGVQITSLAATAGLLTATGFMAFGVYTGYPVPAAFATTGAMVGVGLSLGGRLSPEDRCHLHVLAHRARRLDRDRLRALQGVRRGAGRLR